MKTTLDQFVEAYSTLKAAQLKLSIYEEVVSSYSSQELNDCSTFDEFWQLVDAQNAYEEDWEEDKKTYKPIYSEVFWELKRML
jgi:hypothetical protein